MSWLFLVAYTCSGLAGLIYEVSWTRLLTLYIGHTTGAAAAVVAAFLGGLAVGAAAGGRVASRLTQRRSLQVYAGLEVGVAVAALILPMELAAVTPLLSWAYQDGQPGLLFPIVRLIACLLMVFAPATALGATFPMAVRWFADEARDAARATGTLYVANTIGAAAGAALAGFVLIPSIGISGSIWVGVGASVLAALSVLIVIRSGASPASLLRAEAARSSQKATRPAQKSSKKGVPSSLAPATLAAIVLGLSGFAALVHEIAWTRILTLVLGPTTYAFAATISAVIVGIAIGSAIGSWLLGRITRPAAWLAFTFALSALTATWTYSIAGQRIPSLVAQQVASSSQSFDVLLRQGLLLTAALILPVTVCLGAAFPLALAMARDRSASVAGRFGMVYAINTLGAVLGSLAAGFLLIPLIGLRGTLMVVSGCLLVASLIVLGWGSLPRRVQKTGLVTVAAATAAIVLSPPWDRELLASGVYIYAASAPKDVSLDTLLRAGTLLYYKEGAASTVSVKRLTGTTTLAVDGKVDASNRGDMLTQKLIAHLPLLVHPNPRDVAIIGLGSGVTLGAALRHPIARADVIEISPEVVDASHFFDAENSQALADPRTRLIVGDGRSHLQLSRQQYDVIISEPSNPWIAGVAALFTREFFEAARDRLAPGGVICQWANAYNISDGDLRSIAATFRSVFPDGTIWLVGRDDVLLMASKGPLEPRLANIATNWKRPGVAEDLASVSVFDPFSVLSLFVGGPSAIARYSEGAALLWDDRMTLEFSAPRELHQRRSGENTAALRALVDAAQMPAAIANARASAGTAEFAHRGDMLAKADVHELAYNDFVQALRLDPTFVPALDGLVRTATLTRTAQDALASIDALNVGRPPNVATLVAKSKLLAASGRSADARDAVAEARRLEPSSLAALEQQASLAADAGDLTQLQAAVATLTASAPNRAPTKYYTAVAALLNGELQETVRLGRESIAADPSYAPVYDLIGAAYTKLDQLPAARDAFETGLKLNPHDSAAYANLGLVALAEGNQAAARNYFAEALWLEPESRVAREGLFRAGLATRP